MRLQLLLKTESKCLLTFNYQYPLAGGIYNILSQSSTEYSTFLHKQGYLGPDGKLRKLFTFSRLQISPGYKISKNPPGIILPANWQISLIIASPILEDFIQHFVIGLFKNKYITINSYGENIKLLIESVDPIPLPVFQDQTYFRALSPIVLTTAKISEKGKEVYYYRPLDDKISEAARQSLVKKYQTIYNKLPENESLLLAFDKEYINRKNGKVTTKIVIHEGQPDSTDIIGILCPFTLAGSTELMKIAWLAGIGNKTSMGFGCIDLF